MDGLVPLDWEDKQLVSWVRTERTSYTNGKLSDERIKRLKDIGFEWSVRLYRSLPKESKKEKGWEEMFDTLKKYKKDHGDCNVSVIWILGQWAKDQRTNYKNNNLSEDQIKRLEDIGFELELRSDLTWEEMFEAFKEYKRNHGDCNVPFDWVENDLKQCVWVYKRRYNDKNGRLRKNRI